ncbi:TPA: hypothetical protein ACNFPA_003887 [Enterobacter hormaechei]|uniref:hypothetical protein n=1 Tax=Enterobacter TaxID=547 RepID=UPI002B1E4180|nr:hypothetical protein [Enterobacter quasihormaechei]MEA3785457.1 hypothetical protein [Enterobacter quasihormaechei]MEA3873193.1 hypothetical protein [Enterobacter quasihormaechei]
MSTITKEQAQSVSDLKAGYTLGHADVAILNELARIALASLEVEPVAYMYKDNLHADARFSLHTRFGNWSQEDINEYEITEIPLYTAPPAPVSVADEVLKRLLPDAEKAEFWFEHNGKILFEGVKFNNAVFEACRAAMLHGAEPVTTANKLPDDFDFDRFNDVTWLEAVASNPHMHSPTTSTIAMVALELNRKLAAGNSPVIPDGWVMVPEEPTHEMLEAGDEQFGTYDVYRRMIAASPQQEA